MSHDDDLYFPHYHYGPQLGQADRIINKAAKKDNGNGKKDNGNGKDNGKKAKKGAAAKWTTKIWIYTFCINYILYNEFMQLTIDL